jgi:hypothetical protein
LKVDVPTPSVVKASGAKPVPAKPTAPKPVAQPSQASPLAKAKPAKQDSTEVIKIQNAPARKSTAPQRPKSNQPPSPHEEGEDEFWKFVGE